MSRWEDPRLAKNKKKRKKNINNKKKKTDPRNKGLISEDRGNTPTLPLTIPRSLHRSSAKDPAPPRRLKLPSGPPRVRGAMIGAPALRRPVERSHGARLPPRPSRGGRAYPCSAQWRGRRVPSLPGADSGLEAFSRNPADGSVPPAAFRPGGPANCPNRLFLSYWVELP